MIVWELCPSRWQLRRSTVLFLESLLVPHLATAFCSMNNPSQSIDNVECVLFERAQHQHDRPNESRIAARFDSFLAGPALLNRRNLEFSLVSDDEILVSNEVLDDVSTID